MATEEITPGIPPIETTNEESSPAGTSNQADQIMTATGGIVNQNNQVTNNYSTKQELTYQDPTDKYGNKSDDHKYYDYLNNQELAEFRKSLLTCRIGIISSYDRFAIRAGIFYLLNSQFSSFEQRELKFVGKNDNRTDIHFNTLIDQYFKPETKKIVIISTDDSAQSASFFNEIKDPTFETSLEGFTDLLKETGFVLITVCHYEHIEYCKKNKPVPVWNLSYLQGLIRKEYHDRDFARIHEQLLRIIHLDLLGRTEKTIYKNVRDKLDENKESFREEIFEKNHEITTEGIEAILKKIATENDPKTYFSQDEPLNLYLIYLGTFFTDLSVSEFDYIVTLFLDDPNKFYYATGKGEEKKSLLERWKINPDHFMKKVKLKAYYSEDRQYEIVCFEDEQIRSKFREHLYANFPNFCHTQFIFLYSKGLVLDPEIPKRILDNLITLACELAKRDPDRYTKRLLTDTTEGLAMMVNKKEQMDVEDLINNSTDIKKLLVDFDIKQLEISIIKNYAFERVSRLVNAMLTERKLIPAIENYLDSLLTMGLHEAYVYLLRHSISGFEVEAKCYRIKQALDRAQSDSRINAAYLLTDTVIYNSALLLDNFFTAIQSWYRDDPDIKSLSASFGLSFILGYLDKAIKILPYSAYGKWPSKLHCFSYIETTEQFEKRIANIFQWMFHDKLKIEYTDEQLKNDPTGKKNEEAAQYFLISFIEELYFILKGFDETKSSETENIKPQILEIFWKQLFLLLPKRFSSTFYALMENAAVSYSKKDETAPKENKEEKSFYKTKLKIAGEFKRRILRNKNKHLFI